MDNLLNRTRTDASGKDRTWHTIHTTGPIGTLRVADRGLREGILLEMMRSHAGAS